MKALALGLGGLALALFSLAPPSAGQYMYLDSNGDGVHTAADQVHAVGPTVIDIWFDIAHNRDGSVAVCTGNLGIVLDMFSYQVALRAPGGTVSYSAFTNRVAEMGLASRPPSSDTTRFSTGFYATPRTALPPGKYLLGSVTVSVMSGTPSLDIVSETPSVWNWTLFGTDCWASEYANSYILGIDWSDVDGLPFGTGGGPNQAPTLSPLSDVTVLAGENATQAITASDPEGQPLEFVKTAGPPFMFVATTDKGSATAHGEIRLAPLVSDIGASTGSVTVTDGAASDEKSFAIVVSQTQNHAPRVSSIPTVTVIAGTVRRILLSAGDADGGTLRIAKASGPPYVLVRALAARAGGATASLTLSPKACDLGTSNVVVSVTDGVSQDLSDIEVTVIAPTPPSTSPPMRFPDTGTPHAIALGDLNGDGKLDVVAVHENRATVSVFLGRGDGELEPPTFYSVGGKSLAVTVADFDRNGSQDVAVAHTFGTGLSVLLGRGDGSLLPRTEYATGVEPSGIVAADLNRDAIPDLVACNRGSGSVTVLLGRGDGTFSMTPDTAAGYRPISLVVADVNLDGRPDVTVANSVTGVTTLLGLGDGSFGDQVQTLDDKIFPITLMSGDWNWDGRTDLAFTDLSNNRVRTLSGHGDGTFATPATAANIVSPYGGAAGDLNGDGNADLVVSDIDGSVVVLLGDGRGEFAGPVSLFTGIALAIGDLDSDGRPDLISGGGNAVSVFLNRYGPTGVAETHAWVLSGHRTVPLVVGAGQICIRVEPVGDAYQTGELNLASIVLRSQDTGSVAEIHAISGKSTTRGDTDQNGSPEVGVCFARDDLAMLFDQVMARSTVTAQISGSLTDGRVFCASVELNVLGMPQPAHASFAPNPLNPQSKLTFATQREGSAKVQIFDIHGRLVRTLLDAERLPAGEHEYSFDGKSGRGTGLPSGVFFYRVHSTEGVSGGQIVILK